MAGAGDLAEQNQMLPCNGLGTGRKPNNIRSAFGLDSENVEGFKNGAEKNGPPSYSLHRFSKIRESRKKAMKR